MKIRLMALCVVLALAAVSAFAAGSQQTAAATGAVRPTAPGTFPVVNEPVTLTVFAPQFPTIEDIETNLLTLEYEEKTNVKIEWRLAPLQGFAQARNLLLASGNYPEIMMAATIPPPDQILYGSQGVFLPLNRLIDEWMIHYQNVLDTVPDLRAVITAPDGNIYALGYDNIAFHVSLSQRFWINRVWLDRLGLAVPTTTEELHRVLRAFKDQDANGNGDPNDEIPLAGVMDGVLNPVIFIMNAFIQYGGTDRLLIRDGAIDASFNKPEWRDGLRFLKRLYDERLLEATSFTMQLSQLRQIATRRGDNILGAAPGIGPGNFGSWAGERWLEYEAIPPIAGPNGVRLTTTQNTAQNGTFAITNVAKNPEVAVRWVDWFFSVEGALRQRIGRQGHEWDWGGPEDIGLYGVQAVWKKLTPRGTVQNDFWGRGDFPQTFDHSTQAREGIEGPLYDAAKLYEPFAVPGILPIWVGPEDIQEYAQLETEIRDFVDESTARFITGDLNPETGWDDYIRTLNSIGLPRYLELATRWHSAKYRR